MTRRPSTSSGRSIASRVVPATSETITRSEPSRRLTSVDLPTFGRPTSARRARASLSAVRPPADRRGAQLAALPGGLPLGGQLLDDPVQQVPGAETLGGRDRLRLA